MDRRKPNAGDAPDGSVAGKTIRYEEVTFDPTAAGRPSVHTESVKPETYLQHLTQANLGR